jgi:hypothetical protein
VTITVDTRRYCNETGKFPAGRRCWTFMLRTPRVTEMDYYYNPHKMQSYKAALAAACALAVRRRAETVEVWP